MPARKKASSKKAAPKKSAKAAAPAANDLATFTALSSVLTGFSVVELEGTGATQINMNSVLQKVGQEIMSEILAGATQALAQPDPAAAILNGMWKSPKLGPVIQNMVLLWYNGSWAPMPKPWLETYAWVQPDLSGSAEWLSPPIPYEEALAWRAIFAHPPGAKPTGYGSWAEPPEEVRQRLVTIEPGGTK
jgi:hypothetical protein